jgi:hypothetical protein
MFTQCLHICHWSYLSPRRKCTQCFQKLIYSKVLNGNVKLLPHILGSEPGLQKSISSSFLLKFDLIKTGVWMCVCVVFCMYSSVKVNQGYVWFSMTILFYFFIFSIRNLLKRYYLSRYSHVGTKRKRTTHFTSFFLQIPRGLASSWYKVINWAI